MKRKLIRNNKKKLTHLYHLYLEKLPLNLVLQNLKYWVQEKADTRRCRKIIYGYYYSLSEKTMYTDDFGYAPEYGYNKYFKKIYTGKYAPVILSTIHNDKDEQYI